MYSGIVEPCRLI